MDGKNIVKIRRQRGITQEELAQALSVNTTTLSRWENGHFEPKASMLRGICEVLGCTESELLNGQSPDEWELRVLVNKKGVETVDMTASKSNPFMIEAYFSYFSFPEEYISLSFRSIAISHFILLITRYMFSSSYMSPNAMNV